MVGAGTGTADRRTAVSVVIPAYRAAATLPATLASLQAQSFTDWEAIIVNDGDDAATGAVVAPLLASDGRFKLLAQPQSGAAAARNAGLAVARGTWIQFLDADDQLSSDHLARMMAATATSPDVDLVHCRWQRLAGDLPWRAPHNIAPIDDPVRLTARTCPFAIHGVLTRRASIESVGGFDPTLCIAEDWDLWQRLARAGARFAGLTDHIVDVRVRPGSLSTDTTRHLQDGLRVIRRGHGVEQTAQAGPVAPQAMLAESIWSFTLWIAGAMIGRGGDGDAALEEASARLPQNLSASMIAHILEDAMAVGAGPAQPLWRRWQEFAPKVATLASKIAARSDVDMLDRQLIRGIEILVAAQVPPGVEARIGHIAVVRLDPTQPLADRPLPGIDRIRVTVAFGDRVFWTWDQLGFGALSLNTQLAGIKGLDGLDLRRAQLRERLREGPFATGLPLIAALKRYGELRRCRSRDTAGHDPEPLYRKVLPHLLRAEQQGPLGDAADGRIKAIMAEQRAIVFGDSGPVIAAEPAPWIEPDYADPAYWESLFAKADPWDYQNAYEARKYDQTLELLPDGQVRRALEIACAEGLFTRRLAARADAVLATDIAPTAVARAAAAGADLANCQFQTLDLLTDDPPGLFDLIVCSEVLYYLKPAALAAFVDKVARHLEPEGCFVTAHANLLIDEPDRSGFAWPHHFGAQGIGEMFAGHRALRLEAELHTPLYRIQRFRKTGRTAPPDCRIADTAMPLPERVAAQVKWRGGREAPTAAAWHDFPILMYHRIADDGPAALARYRTTPRAFGQQLAYLRAQGWHGVSLARLRRALHYHEPLPERSVMLTFDDGTTDFLDHAVPLLHRHGFPATLFMPVGHVGGVARWDAGYGPPAPLLDWPALRMLRHMDVAIGAHGVSHAPLPVLDAESIVRELALGRFRLARELGCAVDSIAYPFGAFDSVLRQPALDTGYRFGFTCFDGMVREAADPMVLHRREVMGGIDHGAFERLLGLDQPIG